MTDASGATSYRYDRFGLLTQKRQSTLGTLRTVSYAYDATGNRLSRQPGTQAAQTYTYGAASHRLGSVAGTARAYDAAGNTGSIASTPAIELIHDQRNRLTEYRSGGSMLASYQYSGRGERVAKTQGAATQRFVYDEAGRLIYETGSGSPRTYLWSDDAPIAIIDGTTLTGYIVLDNLGTPRAITDSAGAAIWRWDQVTGSTTTGGSAVFGQGSANTDPDGNGTHLTFKPRFPGQYLDAESGLHYNYFRDYEPGIGRYVQSDPIGLGGGIATYSYVGQSPSIHADATGESKWVDCGGGCRLRVESDPHKGKHAHWQCSGSNRGENGCIKINGESCEGSGPPNRRICECLKRQGFPCEPIPNPQPAPVCGETCKRVIDTTVKVGAAALGATILICSALTGAGA
jgi:RHS repeat-associated protein